MLCPPALARNVSAFIKRSSKVRQVLLLPPRPCSNPVVHLVGHLNSCLLLANMRLVIRLRTRLETKMIPRRRPNRRLAAAGMGVFRALSLNGFGLCVWRWLFDFDLVKAFPFHQGVLSHWQIWFLCGAVLQLMAQGLAKYARDSGELKPSRVMRPQSAARPRRLVHHLANTATKGGRLRRR